jgi:hypothetical protein
MVVTVDENSPRLSVDAAQLLADLPPRVARMETHIEYMRLDIAELKGGMKDLRTELRTDFRWLLGLMVAGFGSLLGVMAQGFHLIGKGQ